MKKSTFNRQVQFGALTILVLIAACAAGVRADTSHTKTPGDGRKLSDSRQAGTKTPHKQATAATPQIQGASIQFLGRDDKTQGNWNKAYGKQGFMLPVQGGSTQYYDPGITVKFVSLPVAGKAASREDDHEGASTLMVWDNAASSKDARLPPAANGLTTRQAVAFRGRGALALRADAGDRKPHQLAIYLLDFQRKGLSVSVEASDGRSRPVDARRADKYAQGAYLRYRFTGSILLVVRSLTVPHPPLLTGVFLDPAGNR